MSDTVTVFSELIGMYVHEIQSITSNDGESSEIIEVVFKVHCRVQGRVLRSADWRMYHSQDCCEHVYLQDIAGDLNDLIGQPLTMAEVVTHANSTPDGIAPPSNPDSYTWSFYKFATVKGYVTLRWLGESNGYYSEEVTFEKVQA